MKFFKNIVQRKLIISYRPEVEWRTQGSRPKPRPKTQKKIRGQGEGQPFQGQTISRPRTAMLETKDQGHSRKCSLKKRSSKKFCRRSPIIGVARIFDWGRPKPQSKAITSSKFFHRGSFYGTKIS